MKCFLFSSFFVKSRPELFKFSDSLLASPRVVPPALAWGLRQAPGLFLRTGVGGPGLGLMSLGGAGDGSPTLASLCRLLCLPSFSGLPGAGFAPASAPCSCGSLWEDALPHVLLACLLHAVSPLSQPLPSEDSH